MAFQINKKKTVEAFRAYAKKFDRPQDDYHPKHAKKIATPTKYFVWIESVLCTNGCYKILF